MSEVGWAVGLLLIGCCLFVPVLFTYCCTFEDFAARCLPKVDDNDRVVRGSSGCTGTRARGALIHYLKV